MHPALPSSTVHVKICGLTTPETVDAACEHGAAFIGFVIHPASVRHIAPKDAATLAARLPAPIASVAVCVNPDDTFLDTLLRAFTPHYLQLHGDETPQRVADIREKYSIPIIKALRVANADDLLHADAYAHCAQMLLLDAHIPHAKDYGGMGHRFDWSWLDDFSPALPWFLSGGLQQSLVEEALTRTHARYLDISSGVESSRGVKDNDKIIAFLRTVQHFSKGHAS